MEYYVMKKRILALLLLIVLAFSLVACGETGEPTVSGSDVSSQVGTDSGTTDTSSDDSQEEELQGYDKSIEHKFIACDIRNHGIVVFDLNAVDGDPMRLSEDAAVVWEWDADEDPNCTGVAKIWTSISGVRFRYSEYYEKDVVVACATYGWVGIIDYETRTVLWESTDPILSGVHSVEMLPNGDVVAGVSADPGAVVYFAVSAGIDDPVHSIDSLWCHGVCWDPENECLWVLEDKNVYQAFIQNVGTENAKLMRVNGSGDEFDGDGAGHAFAPVAGEPGKYWASSGRYLWKFDTETEELTKAKNNLHKNSIKGVCSFTDGTMVQAVAGLFGANEKEFGSDGFRVIVQELTPGKVAVLRDVEYLVPFPHREFYKVQAFTKDYQ